MNIRRAEFLTSMSRYLPGAGGGLPEIAMAGKSNVGKSSLINRLASNKKLARTSAEPGKTRLINLYRINGELILTDLPGYGFAKVSKEEKQRWANMIEGYLGQSENLRYVLQLVDMRHAPTEDDQTMVRYLRHYDIPFTVIATKADKLSKAERSRSIPVICRSLQVQHWEVIPFSAQDGTGKEPLLQLMEQILQACNAQEEGEGKMVPFDEAGEDELSGE